MAEDPQEPGEDVDGGARHPDGSLDDQRVDTAPAGRRIGARVALGSMRAAVALVSLSVLAASGYGWLEKNRINAGAAITDVIDAVPGGHRARDGAVDILLAGMDSRTDAQGRPLPPDVLDQLHAGDDGGELNTDTMILVHIPMDGSRAAAISFPRDSYVQLAGGFGKHKLNSAYARAKADAIRSMRSHGIADQATIERESTVAGRKNLIKTIEDLTGGAVSIDRYAEVNLASFYEVSKVVGGVEVCVREQTRDQLSGASFRAGRQLVDGAQALAFVRQRHGLPGGDLDRIVRQQAFIGAVVRKVLAGGMLTDPHRLNDLVDAVQRSVVLSQGWDLTSFAEQMQDLAGGKMQFRTIPVVGEASVAGEGDVLLVNPHEVRNFITGLAGDGQPAAAPSPGPTSTPPQPRARSAEDPEARPSAPETKTGPAVTPAPPRAPGTTRPVDPDGSGDPSGWSSPPRVTPALDESLSGDEVPCVN